MNALWINIKICRISLAALLLLCRCLQGFYVISNELAYHGAWSWHEIILKNKIAHKVAFLYNTHNTHNTITALLLWQQQFVPSSLCRNYHVEFALINVFAILQCCWWYINLCCLYTYLLLNTKKIFVYFICFGYGKEKYQILLFIFFKS